MVVSDRVLLGGACAPMRPMVTILAAAIIGLASVVNHPSSADAGGSRPVIAIHGVDVLGDPGADCGGNWNDMERKFHDWGLGPAFIEVSYYHGDTHCDHTINHHGRHGRHHGSGHYSNGTHGANTDIRHLGYHLAWYIYRHFTSQGRTVDVVAHSMGGLVIRYALAQVARDHPRFPPRLAVEDVVTMGTPHGGARAAVWLCPYTQCDQMHAGSAFLEWLEEHAWEPDGVGGTDWSTFGSDDDNYVAADRAVFMGACHKTWYLSSSNIEHDDFLHVRSGDTGAKKTTADVRRRNCPHDWVTDETSHWPVRRAYLAATSENY
jgi:hypothetical protein